jgi:queuine/archaeosine tRNA-ribosyltransferase
MSVSSSNLFHVTTPQGSNDDQATAAPTQRAGLLFPSQARQLNTPNFMIGTARGSTPHLTPDMVDTLPEYRAMQVSLGEVNSLHNALKSYQEANGNEKPYHDMLVLPKNHLVAMGLRNPSTDLMYYTKRYVPTNEQIENEAQFPYQLSAKIAATRSDTGAIRMTPKEFLQRISTFKPDLLLLDGQDSDVYDTKSRAEKTMRRNLEWVDQLYADMVAMNKEDQNGRSFRIESDINQVVVGQENSKKNPHSGTISTPLSPTRPLVIIPIEGGSHNDKRTRNGGVMSRKGTSLWQHMDQPKKDDFNGNDEEYQNQERKYQDKITNDGYTVDVIADGYHIGGLGSANNSQQRQSMIRASFQYINKNDQQANIPTRLRLTTITGEPVEVIDMVANGIDLLSVTYPQTLTEEGLAMKIPIRIQDMEDIIFENNQTSSSTERIKKANFIQISDNDKLHEYNIMNLRDDRYVEDQLPIDPNCTCYSCQHHSRSYINHLLNTHEMLADVLLMLHNMHQYSLFFQNIRDLIQVDDMNQIDNNNNNNTPVQSQFQYWTQLANQIYVPHVDILHRNARKRYVHQDTSKKSDESVQMDDIDA